MLYWHNCPVPLDSETQAELNITTKGSLDTASMSLLMLWQNAGTFYAQTSMTRHKASHLMQDTLKSQKTVRRKRKISPGGLTKKWVTKAEWVHWKKNFPVYGWRTGTDKGRSGANRILLKCPIHCPLPCSGDSSSEQGAGAAGAEACRRLAGQELRGQPQSPTVPAGCCANSASQPGLESGGNSLSRVH